MGEFKMKLLKISAWLLILLSQNSFAASYQLSFSWEWDGTDVEDGRLPNFAHFTDLVGATHQAGSALWTPGGLATPGIERVAEDGQSDILISEVDNLIDEGIADQFINVGAPRVFLQRRSIIISQIPATLEITVNEEHPEISLISMIAPSPDWFVGVSGLALFDGEEWVDSLTLDLRPWDAGTENGVDFDLTNVGTIPQRTIERITNSPFTFDEQPIVAQLQIERLDSSVNPIPVPAALPLMASAFICLVRARKA